MKRCRVEILAGSVCSSLFFQIMQVFLLHSCLVLYRLCDECLVITMTTDVGEGLLKFFIIEQNWTVILGNRLVLSFF